MNGDERLFLGVRRSARGMAWRHRLSERQEAVALAIAQGSGTAEIVARVLAARGITADGAARFLDPTVRDLLPDPASLTDMAKAGARLADAVERRERVAIFGDYDVDGACASALLKRFLAHYGVEAEIYIPDRIFEGYGPNPEAMRELAGRGASLIVTVDCGTNSAGAIEAARQAGAQVVIVFPHWGTEYDPTPFAGQQALAHAAIEAGADMVIGNHAHWAGAVEVYEGKPIWYALGNFIFDQTWSEPTMEGMTLELTFDGAELVQARMRPHIILDKAQPNFLDPAGDGRVVMGQVFDASKGLLPW